VPPLGVTVVASWSKTGTWSYTKPVPAGTTARLVMWQKFRKMRTPAGLQLTTLQAGAWETLIVPLRIGSVVINCVDMDGMTEFWSSALGLRVGPLSSVGDFRVLRGPYINLSLQRAATPVSCRDQMHLDLYTSNQAGELDRLVALGAQMVREHHDPDDDYVVLADPEGNEFCICAVPHGMMSADGSQLPPDAR
jgi:catechol 2,3-dioxygenase-like lactoylglutathione lyase family enzyme